MLSEEEKKAIEDLKELSHYCSLRAIDIDDKNSDVWARYVCSIQIIKNLIEKQDKTINEMAEMLLKDHEWFYSEFDNYTVEDFIEYFEKKVGE